VTDTPKFEVFIDDDGVCIVRGELDGFTGPVVESALAQRVDVSTVDLGEVSFVDSAGLRALLVVRLWRAEAGGALTVRRSSGAVRRVMRLAGVSELCVHEPNANPTAAG
jgi:anti-anti-sigma factor